MKAADVWYYMVKTTWDLPVPVHVDEDREDENSNVDEKPGGLHVGDQPCTFDSTRSQGRLQYLSGDGALAAEKLGVLEELGLHGLL